MFSIGDYTEEIMKCIIIGAGATAFCDIANPDRRPPLVRVEDFLRIFKAPLDYSLPSSRFGETFLNPFFCWAFEYFSDDIEELFTILYLISKENSYAGIQEKLKEKYIGEPWLERALVVASKLNFSIVPRNILTDAIGLVSEEIKFCLGTSGSRPQKYENQPLSDQHRKLVRGLGPGDSVVSFNYDTVADYALLNEYLLSTKSFKNSHLNPVRLPEAYEARGEPVFLFKPHGSFNWFSPLEDPERVGVFFGRRSENTEFLTPTPLILPYHAKKAIVDDHPVFKMELEGSLEAIGSSDQIVLVGKQFVSRDSDLCEGIKNACSGKKRSVTYVNPESSDGSWLLHHDDLFNASNRTDRQRLFANLSKFLEDDAAS